MQNLSLKKSTQKIAANRSVGRRINLRAMAQIKGIPEFMLRLAQEQHVKIFQDQVIPKYRHD